MNALTNGSRPNLLPMNVFSGDLGRWLGEFANDEMAAARAPVSIWEDDTHFFLEFDLPGVVVDDVDVTVQENVLKMTANRRINSDVSFIQQERRFGSIQRLFRLPARIDDAGIQAEMDGGVLKVTIPKAPESRVKKIQITGN